MIIILENHIYLIVTFEVTEYVLTKWITCILRLYVYDNMMLQYAIANVTAAKYIYI